MEPRVADFHHIGVGEAITNSADAAVSQDPVNISSVPVPHTNINNSVGGESLVSKPLPTIQDSLSRSALKREDYNSITNFNNFPRSSLKSESKRKLHIQASTNLTKKEHELNELKKDLKKKDQELYQLRSNHEVIFQTKGQELNELKKNLKKKDQELYQFWSNHEIIFQTKDQELNELKKNPKKKDQELYQLRSNHEVILQTKDQELDEVRKLWKQAGSDLNKFIAQGQRFHQVTDEELIQKVTQLRYIIRNFADQQFGGDPVDAKSLHSLWKSINNYSRVSFDSLEACMKDPSSRPMIIGAILWEAIEMDIFGQFVWAGKHVSNAMHRLEHVLKPDEDDALASSHEAKRKFQTWKASTTTLLLESEKLDKSGGHGSHRRPNESKLHDTICKSLSPFSKSKDKDLGDQLFRIFDEALNLDKLISKQAAEVIWLSDSSSRSGRFSQDLVKLAELQQDEKQTGDNGNTWLVSAPGMIKRGKSTGEDFDLEILLLKMKIFQEPGNIEQIGESHKKSTDSFCQSI